jgi:putative transposase
MLDSKHLRLSLKRQCDLLGINRSSVYYKPRPQRLGDLKMMKLIDAQYMKTPSPL